MFRWLTLPRPQTLRREIIGDNDRQHLEDFVTGHECVSIEKLLRNRAMDRGDEALDPLAKDDKRRAAIERREEILDILREWSNLRSEMQNADE